MSSETEVVTFQGVGAESIDILKELNSVIFPIKYQESIYRDILKCGDVTQLAMLHGKCIGAIAGRLQMIEEGSAKLYILTLGVLEAYRNQAVGSELLRRSLLACQCDEVIKHAELHVHITNTGAIRFYEKHGFKKVKVQRGYYSKLTPGDAVLLQRDMVHINTDPPEMANCPT
eukprot:jgi/Ulvmu1/621/UM001_0629.1